jgi:hypothetical protein
MTMEEDLARLVRETVKVEVENHMRTRSSELIGRGGDVVLGGMGNIYLQPGVNKKAYYKGTEIGTGTGGGVTDHGALTGLADDDHTQYLLATGARPITGDQSIYSEKAFKFYEDAGSVLDGKIYADLDVEVVRHFYIWASASTYIDLKPAVGSVILTAAGSIYLNATTGIDALSNKIVGLAAGTEAGNAVRYEQVLLLSGGTMSGAIAMGTNKITGLGNPTNNQDAATKYYVDNNPVANADTLDGYHASAFALLAANNIFTGNKQYLLGVGGSEANYPQWLMQNTTYGATYYSVLRLNDLGKLELKSAEGSVLSTGSFSTTGSVTASTQLISSVATGTAPLSVTSTTLVTNLNADTVDGIHASGLGAVTSVFGRTGAVVAATDDYTWAQVNKSTSSLSDIATPNMGSKDIYFNDGYGIDFRNDNVHKLSYASGSNSLQISTYDVCNFYFTRDSSTRLSVDYDGVRFGHAAFFRKNHADDLTYIVDGATGDMEFHVGTGDKFKFVIG